VAGYRVQSATPLPAGKSTVRVEFTPDEKGPGKPATVKIFVNGKETGSGRVERTVPMAYSVEGFDVGMDNVSPVSPDYKAPNAFRGKVNSVKIEVSP
jgi:arylsulfatase